MEATNSNKPPKQTVKQWFEALDHFSSEPFPEREQPVAPERDIFLGDDQDNTHA